MLSDFVISNTKLQSWSNAQNYKKEKKNAARQYERVVSFWEENAKLRCCKELDIL